MIEAADPFVDRVGGNPTGDGASLGSCLDARLRSRGAGDSRRFSGGCAAGDHGGV